MRAKSFALAFLGSALLFAPALAQTQPPGSAAPAKPGSSMPSTSMPSSSTSGQMDTSGWMTQEKAGQWRASKMEGMDVYNGNNEKVGDISELLVDDTGKVQAVVVGVGGFLGMGEHNVAVPFDQIKFVNEPRRTAAAPSASGTTAPSTTGTVTSTQTSGSANVMPDHAMLNMTKDQLKAAPEFKYAR